MAKFRFRLSPLRKLREAHRDQMQAKLAEALQAEQRLQQQLDHMRREISSSQNSHRALLQDARTDVHQLLESQRYQFILRAEESTMKGQTQLLATEVERRRRAMVEAHREVRVLDNLQQRQFAAHQQKLQKADVKELDEIASRQAED